jgi:hypothetical protein
VAVDELDQALKLKMQTSNSFVVQTLAVEDT